MAKRGDAAGQQLSQYAQARYLDLLRVILILPMDESLSREYSFKFPGSLCKSKDIDLKGRDAAIQESSLSRYCCRSRDFFQIAMFQNAMA